MHRDDRLADLIDRWEELRSEGKSPSAAELARESPELIGPLREWITAFDLADRMEARVASTPGKRWRIDAEHVSFHDLSNTILAHGLVGAIDLDRAVADFAKEESEPTASELSSDLIRRGWITSAQSEILLAGGGGELVVGDYVLLDPSDKPGRQRFHARHRLRGELVVLERTPNHLADGVPGTEIIRLKGGTFRVRECPADALQASGLDGAAAKPAQVNPSKDDKTVSPRESGEEPAAACGDSPHISLLTSWFLAGVVACLLASLAVAGWFLVR